MASLNAGPEYYAAEARYRDAKTDEAKLAALNEMLRLCPKHKGSQSILAEIRDKIARNHAEQAREAKREAARKASRRAAGGAGDFVKRAGAAQVALIGKENTGKSFLLNELTNAHSESTPVPFETQHAVPGIMLHEKVQIQLVDTPSVTAQNKGTVYSIARAADLAVVLLNDENDENEKTLYADLNAKRTLFASSREDDAAALKKKIYYALGLVRVFTKNPKDPRGAVDYEHPIALFEGKNTVLDAAREIHKELAAGFAFARVWGSRAKFAGQQVGADYVLRDGDVIEIHLK
jgi:ribosome-interacting GTPase 1